MTGTKVRAGEQTVQGISVEYRAWSNMRSRCNPKNQNHKYYADRGIRVCDRWNDYAAFLDDMGRRPHDGLSLDRIDNDGIYEPGNCRWATKEQQCASRRTQNIARGERHVRCTIPDQKVRDIRANFALCRVTRTELSKRFGVSLSYVSKLVRSPDKPSAARLNS